MHREHKVKRENQQDATNSMFIIKLSISTCFGHHYAHHRENKTVSYCMRCSARVCRLWLAVVLWSCVMSCVHCESNSNFHAVHTAHNTAPQDHSLHTQAEHGMQQDTVLFSWWWAYWCLKHVEIESLMINIELVASYWFSFFTLRFTVFTMVCVFFVEVRAASLSYRHA